MRPKGRRSLDRGPGEDAKWQATVARLDRGSSTPVATATAGPIRIVGRLVRTAQSLGGAPGRECVWRNRVGGRSDSAVAADVVIMADDTGRCAVEDLEYAKVIGPTDTHSIHHESVSLLIGDQVEVLGSFSPDLIEGDEGPAQAIYGTLGADGGLLIRVLDRPPAPEPSP